MIDLMKEVQDAKRIGISGHVNPDGDCIGSTLALYAFLKKAYPEKIVRVFLQKPTEAFAQVPLITEIDSTFQWEQEEPFDIFFVLDTVPGRIGGALPLYEQAKKTINIDHHISNAKGSSMVNCVVPTASATAEIMCECIPREYWDREIAQLLYMGLAHDTGVFQYSNVSPKTLRYAADLISFGFDFSKLLDDTFYKRTELQMRIQCHVFMESKRYFDGRLIVGSMNLKEMEHFGATKSDFEGIVSQLRTIRGVECSVFLYEKEPNLFKLSMRTSTDTINVSEICSAYGGGGHIRAAGADLLGEEEELKKMIIADVAKQLERN